MKLLGAKIYDVVRSEGFWGLIRHAVRKVAQIRRLFFFEADLTQPLPNVTARIPVEIRTATLKDLEIFANELEQRAGLNRQEAQQRLKAGNVAVLALCDRKLAGIQWLTFTDRLVTDIGRKLVLAPGEACDFAAVTFPEWRGKGIASALMRAVNEYERTHGYTRHIAWVRSNNVPSLRIQTKLGRKRTKTVWSIWVLGMKQPLVFGATQKGSPSLVPPGPHPLVAPSRSVTRLSDYRGTERRTRVRRAQDGHAEIQ